MTNSNTNVVDINNAVFTYPEDQNRIVINIDKWQIQESEHVFIHGPSGSGKSTLLNLVSGILCPDSGAVSIINKPLNKMSPSQRDAYRAANIGYVFQRFNLIPYLSSIDNIRLARHLAGGVNDSLSDSEVEVLLSELNISAQQWNKPVRTLSVGQQQRIAIARAMVNKPGLLIADEATSSLDQKNRDTFMSILMKMANANAITLLFVSHDLSLKKYFSRVESMTEINQAEI